MARRLSSRRAYIGGYLRGFCFVMIEWGQRLVAVATAEGPGGFRPFDNIGTEYARSCQIDFHFLLNSQGGIGSLWPQRPARLALALNSATS